MLDCHRRVGVQFSGFTFWPNFFRCCFDEVVVEHVEHGWIEGRKIGMDCLQRGMEMKTQGGLDFRVHRVLLSTQT